MSVFLGVCMPLRLSESVSFICACLRLCTRVSLHLHLCVSVCLQICVHLFFLNPSTCISIVVTSLVVEHRLHSCGVQAWIFPSLWDIRRPGIEPASPALAGGFFPTEPPGKSWFCIYTSVCVCISSSLRESVFIQVCLSLSRVRASIFMTTSAFLVHLCGSAVIYPGACLSVPVSLCIYHCICTSIFFMHLCASVCIYLCVCIYYCVRVSRVSVCGCIYMPDSVYIYSPFRVSVFITASVRLYSLCICVSVCAPQASPRGSVPRVAHLSVTRESYGIKLDLGVTIHCSNTLTT